MATLRLEKELARDLADTEAPCHALLDAAPVEAVIENRHTGEETRWTSIHELVIRTTDGKLWRQTYQQGLTEYQEGVEAFEGHRGEVPFVEVKAVPVVAYNYEPV